MVEAPAAGVPSAGINRKLMVSLYRQSAATALAMQELLLETWLASGLLVTERAFSMPTSETGGLPDLYSCHCER